MQVFGHVVTVELITKQLGVMSSHSSYQQCPVEIRLRYTSVQSIAKKASNLGWKELPEICSQ